MSVTDVQREDPKHRSQRRVLIKKGVRYTGDQSRQANNIQEGQAEAESEKKKKVKKQKDTLGAQGKISWNARQSKMNWHKRCGRQTT